MKEANGPPSIPAPRANPDLFGHERAERMLIEAYRSGRLAHAWLLAGPKGIGKATLAYRFARYVFAGGGDDLLDRASESLRLDPDHPVFRRTASGGHADLRTVERSIDPKKAKDAAKDASEAARKKFLRTEIVVADVRALGAFFRLTPAEGGWRIAVIDAADEMNRNAANALLKVLEEPPQRSLLLLVSHRPARLLPTIRSRCRKLALQPLPTETVARIVVRARPELDAAEVQALTRLAEGSAGRALELAARGGLDLYREMVKLLSGLPRLDITALVALSDRIARTGADDAFETITDLLRWWLARLVSGRAAGRPPQEVVAGEGVLIARLVARGDLDQWLQVWDKVNRLVGRAYSVNLDRKQVVMNAFLALEGAARA